MMRPLQKRVMTAQQRAADPEEEDALNMVRGGSVCEMGGSQSANLIKGSMKPGICVTTPPKNPKGDPRPRWRVAGEAR